MDDDFPTLASSLLRSNVLALFAENLYPQFDVDEISYFIQLLELLCGPAVCSL